jgi:hypothetical protein
MSPVEQRDGFLSRILPGRHLGDLFRPSLGDLCSGPHRRRIRLGVLGPVLGRMVGAFLVRPVRLRLLGNPGLGGDGLEGLSSPGRPALGMGRRRRVREMAFLKLLKGNERRQAVRTREPNCDWSRA